MNDHAAVYRHIRLTLSCYVLWRLETELGRGAAADAAFGDRDIQRQISADAKTLTLRTLGPQTEPKLVGPTLEQEIAFELAECMARNEESPEPSDRPVLASQVVTQSEARRARELLVIAFRRHRQRRQQRSPGIQRHIVDSPVKMRTTSP